MRAILEMGQTHQRVVHSQEEADAFVAKWPRMVIEHLAKCDHPDICVFDVEALLLTEDEIRTMVVIAE